ncbi:glycosyltransferase family 1 protein [Mucilaginibacter sp. cycad4]|uniref:glycosyltransferase family 4 protein n=1 Tax=Mucilaginibacter sp. cycad4 TaxID=3342096 RepID=UPI002AABC2D4|nr:glycosyltransferase family 1 protein [Mucilaginibacter gossypii]WPV02346.1 glycosyltransferase family 1 protein [Mucilaginibacter gossypii]
MKIAFDGIVLSKQATGVADITISIINSFVKNFENDEIFILVNNPLSEDVLSRINITNKVKIIQKQLPFLRSINLLWSVFKLNQIIRELDPDVFIESNFTITPFFFPSKPQLVVYVHDVAFLEYPQTVKCITKTHLGLFFKRSLKRADLIWTNSEYTKQRLEKHFKQIIAGKSVFAGSGINSAFLKKRNEVSNLTETNFQVGNLTIDFDYFLFVGTIEPRKNISFLLKLFAVLKDEKKRLIIVGGKGWGKEDKIISDIITTNGYPKDRLVFTGYVKANELVALYKHATMFISTSLNEGLGLPQLEAMACGCPVITPHNSAMIEVVKDAGITVDNWDLNKWEEAIKHLESHKDEYRMKGFLRVQQYDWDETIKKIYSEHLALIHK